MFYRLISVHNSEIRINNIENKNRAVNDKILFITWSILNFSSKIFTSLSYLIKLFTCIK